MKKRAITSKTSPTLYFNVLGYVEEDEWVALALEMDLRGYGSSFEEALQHLEELVEMQISFAIQKNQPEMIWFPAEAIWWERFAEARREAVTDFLMKRSEREAPFRAGGIQFPSLSAKAATFQPVHA